MKFKIDHDMHIHSLISPCAGNDPRQTPEAILTYGVTNGLRLLCMADHYWDEKAPHISEDCWLNIGNDTSRARSVLPLPQSNMCRFLFGMEVDMDYGGNLGVTPEEAERLDFIVFSPNHLHQKGMTVPIDMPQTIEAYKTAYLDRMDNLLSRDDIPWHKTGLAHPILRVTPFAKDHLMLYDAITDAEWEDMWIRVRNRGMGVEINIPYFTSESIERALRPYRIAKKVGCKFYLGGDAHSPEDSASVIARFRKQVDLLDLDEEDKLPFVREHLASIP